MNFRQGKSSDEKPAPVWFVVEREDYGSMATVRTSRQAAIDDFTATVARATENGEAYTPYDRLRRLSVIGPDVHTRADGDDAVLYPMPDDEAEDPPLIGEAALRAVLEPDEYELFVQKPIASALLES